MTAVSLQASETELQVSAPTVLFPAPPSPGGPRQAFDVSSDGRFLMNMSGSDQSSGAITVILNWSAGRKR
jgi:hypothetical protein